MARYVDSRTPVALAVSRRLLSIVGCVTKPLPPLLLPVTPARESLASSLEVSIISFSRNSWIFCRQIVARSGVKLFLRLGEPWRTSDRGLNFACRSIYIIKLLLLFSSSRLCLLPRQATVRLITVLFFFFSPSSLFLNFHFSFYSPFYSHRAATRSLD